MLNAPRACVNQDSPGTARGSHRAFRMLNFEDLGGNRTRRALEPGSDRHKPAICCRSLLHFVSLKIRLKGRCMADRFRRKLFATASSADLGRRAIAAGGRAHVASFGGW